jgi:hypothetical protein
MKVAGLLSSKQEATEIQFITKICKLKDRIRYLVRHEKIKGLLKDDWYNACDIKFKKDH